MPGPPSRPRAARGKDTQVQSGPVSDAGRLCTEAPVSLLSRTGGCRDTREGEVDGRKVCRPGRKMSPERCGLPCGVREGEEVVGAVREMQTPSIGAACEGRGIPPRLPHILRSGCLGLGVTPQPAELSAAGSWGGWGSCGPCGCENEASLLLQSACAFHPRLPSLLPQQGFLRRRFPSVVWGPCSLEIKPSCHAPCFWAMGAAGRLS